MLFMAHAAHRAVGAASAAGGLALLSVPDHPHNHQSDNSDKYECDDDCSDAHVFPPLLPHSGFLVLLDEQHVDNQCKSGQSE